MIPYPTGDPRTARRINQEAILRLLRQRGPLSRAQIARELGLNPSTVGRLVDPLLEVGLLQEMGAQATGRQGGRPARLVRFNSQAGCIATLDLSGEIWQAALTDLNGEIVETFQAHPVPGDAQANLSVLEDLLHRMLDRPCRLGRPRPQGIGVGAPSIVLWESGTVVWAASLGWRDLPLKAWIEARWPVPVFVENDVNLLALGESWRGAGRGSRYLAVLAVGTGVGAGLVLDGRVYRGASEAAGEVGYLPPTPEALGRTYRGYGPLEEVAGLHGLVRRARESLEAGASSVLAQADPLSSEAVFQAAREGDPLAVALMAEMADHLAMAVAALAVVLNPERILLGGQAVHAADLLLPALGDRLQGLVPSMPELDAAQLGDRAILVGAAALVLRNTQIWVDGIPLVVP